MRDGIRCIHLHDFRALRDVTLDLTEGNDGKAKHLAMIFGENGIGKSNLLESVAFLKMSLDTRLLRDAPEAWGGPETFTGETDLEGPGSYEFRVPFPIPPVPVWDIRSLADRFRSIGARSGPEIDISFTAGGSDGRYVLRIGDDGRVCGESLRYRINSNTGMVFSIESSESGPRCEFSGALFKGAGARHDFEEMIEADWGDHSFLSILKSESLRGGTEGIGTGVLDAIGFLDGIVVLCRESGMMVSDGLDPVLRSPMSGTVEASMRPRLEAYGRFLNYLLFGLVSEFRGAAYHVEESDGAIRYSLHVSRLIGGTQVDVPVDRESEGVRRIVSMSPGIYMLAKGMPVLIDDFDAGLHVVLVPDLLDGMTKGEAGQLVAATHCTRILEDVGPQSCYVVQGDMDGNRWCCSFPRVSRTMTNHNNRGRYEAGVFGGIPHVGVVDPSTDIEIAEDE